MLKSTTMFDVLSILFHFVAHMKLVMPFSSSSNISPKSFLIPESFVLFSKVRAFADTIFYKKRRQPLATTGLRPITEMREICRSSWKVPGGRGGGGGHSINPTYPPPPPLLVFSTLLVNRLEFCCEIS